MFPSTGIFRLRGRIEAIYPISTPYCYAACSNLPCRCYTSISYTHPPLHPTDVQYNTILCVGRRVRLSALFHLHSKISAGGDITEHRQSAPYISRVAPTKRLG